MEKIAILITHGTDTLAWTHAFVRYAIKKNKINIAITGSQIPLPALPNFSDAYINIANSIRFLTHIVPPNVFTVFNYGTHAFSDSLYKVDRWNNKAFTGGTIASMEWDEVRNPGGDIQVVDEPVKLDKLYLLTTGGTIASTFNDKNALSPIRTPILEDFLVKQFSDSFACIEEREALVIDSSDLTFDKMEKIVRKALECMHDSGYMETFADLNFDTKIKIIYADPFKTISDYRREIKDASGVVIAGYGGGNINIETASGNSPLPLIKELINENIPVVLASQVALGVADFIYENARLAIESGAISGVDLSLPEIQIRLAYLLGHKRQIEETAKRLQIPYLTLFDRLFISGMKFRTRKSKEMYKTLKGFGPSQDDILINMTFEESLFLVETLH